MMTSAFCPCLICYCDVGEVEETEKTENYEGRAETELENTENNRQLSSPLLPVCTIFGSNPHRNIEFAYKNEMLTLQKFVSSFQINLPLRASNDRNIEIQWDPEEDSSKRKSNFPFCSTCKFIARNLVELHERLESIKKEIDQAKRSIRSSILKSIKQNRAKDYHFVGPKCKGKWALMKERRNIDIIRDLILGPVLRISKCNDFPLKSVDGVSTTAEKTSGQLHPDVIKEDIHEPVLNDSNDSSTNEAHGSDSYSNDEDFTLSDTNDFEQDLIPSKTKLLPKTKSTNLRRRRKKRITGSISDETPNPKLQQKWRKTVKCDGQDKFIYDNQYEFFGNPREGFQCALCPGRKFSNKSKVTCHVREAHTPKGKACPICGKCFRMTKLVNQHIRNTHDSDKSVVCEICGKSVNRSTLSTHKKTVHVGERRFICELCGKGFTSSQVLRRHMASHSTSQPYECSHCGQRFKKKGTRTRHLKTFHGYVPSEPPVEDGPRTKLELEGIANLNITEAKQQIVDSRGAKSKCILSEIAKGANEISLPIVSNTVPTEPLVDMETCMEEDEGGDDPSKLSLKCKLCGLQYNRQNNLTRHLLQIHHINVKGLAWKGRRTKPEPVPEYSSKQQQLPFLGLLAPVPPLLPVQPPLTIAPMLPFPLSGDGHSNLNVTLPPFSNPYTEIQNR